MEISQRVEAYIEKNFLASEAGILKYELASLSGEVAEKGGEFSERIASAIIIIAELDFDLLGAAVDLTKRDWRDVLSSSGLEMEDWRLKVGALLGPPA